MQKRTANVALCPAGARIFMRRICSNACNAIVLRNFFIRSACGFLLRTKTARSGETRDRAFVGRDDRFHWFPYCSRNCQAAPEDNTCIGTQV